MFRFFRVLAIGLACCLLPSGSLWAWWDAGHMAIALVARDQLSPQACARVNELLAVPMDLEAAEDPLVQASVWPDLLKERGVRAFDSWHYLGIPYCPAGARVRPPREPNGQLVASVEQCLGTLGNPMAGRWEKAFMLRWLIHLVGDLHQPLHCVDRYDRSHPRGDMGGLAFAVSYGKVTNLHFLWDAGAGLLPDLRYGGYRRSAEDGPSEALRALARQLQLEYPRTAFPQLAGGSPKAWVMESHRLARNVAYQGIRPGQAPSAAYLARSRRVVARQLALAGYRLADLLNGLFP